MSNALLGNVLRHTYTKEQGSNTLFRTVLHCTTMNLRITFNGIVFNIVSDLRNVEGIQKSTLIGFFEWSDKFYQSYRNIFVIVWDSV